MQGSSSISSSSVDAPTPRCHCGVKSPIRTAWKCDYPGKRFYGCSGYRTSRKCLFFQWYDPEPPARYSDIIRRLLETNKGIRSENTELKKTRQELLDELHSLQQSVHETRADLEAAIAASTAMEDNMLASVATTRRRGVLIMVLISVIILLGFFPNQIRLLSLFICIFFVFTTGKHN
ncbi:hypothetical protein HN51_028751 [Arachis hypogaea]|uniref:GRF-type domain-containing protein n=1 Tax=Arachis hypogaea TaxID=3818 RepID=A0A445BHA4_ARAHY|nr:uncharacterized protein LOC112709381 [Arachis hypogaea]RYR38062.1 hypothetical protein Ahy_A09g043011 isoform C [Arachis hypogaea]